MKNKAYENYKELYDMSFIKLITLMIIEIFRKKDG